ncbi:MAG: carboxypeptidase regulatory-like domain-containing protein [Thermoplasmata archaeon]|nr:carboxypeptidase regulatory-like domain-containing protein [Thermoplasmata archaeon]
MDARSPYFRKGPKLGRLRARRSGLLAPGAIVGVALMALVAAGVPSVLAEPSSGPAAAGLRATSGFPTPIRHVVVVMLENQELAAVLSGGPYEAYLASHYAAAGQFYSAHHYSLPDYLAATSGLVSTPSKPVATTSVGDLVQARGLGWKGIMESMPQACDRTDAWSAGYDTAHDPFIWYKNVVSSPTRCDTHVVDLSAWNSSLLSGKLPNYVFVSPNTYHDTHNGTLAAADQWVENFTQGLLAYPKLFASTALFVTYDEGTTNAGYNGSFGGHLYMALVSPYARMGYSSPHLYNTVSLLTTAEWLLGLGRTGHHDNWTVNPPMTDLFDFAPTHTVSGTVTDGGGQPLVAANVTDGLGVTATTGVLGNFSMTLPDGSYVLSAALDGRGSASQNVTVSGANITGVDFVVGS